MQINWQIIRQFGLEMPHQYYIIGVSLSEPHINGNKLRE